MARQRAVGETGEIHVKDFIAYCGPDRGTGGGCVDRERCEKPGASPGNSADAAWNLKGYDLVDIRQRPELSERAATWFNERWGVPREAYLARISACLTAETPNGWYLCLDGGRIVGGLGVIDNDFHDRPDLAPNVCAVYTEEAYRGRGIAGRLLDFAVADMRARGVSPLYLVSDHVGFYERYGWEFVGMVRERGASKQTRMYVHR